MSTQCYESRRQALTAQHLLYGEQLGREAEPNSQRYLDIIDLIEQSHLATVREAVARGPAHDSAVADVRAECARLRSFMSAAEVIDEISPRSRDVMILTGKKLALTSAPSTRPSTTTSPSGSPRCSPTCRTGYVGAVPGSILTTIGRGYTDLTAALIAVGVRAQEVQIWKEVDGIFTADPRKAPKARLLPAISPEKAAELTYHGSEVIHPFTMEQLIRAKIPIRIKNAFKPEGDGTVIVPTEDPHAKAPCVVVVVAAVALCAAVSAEKAAAAGVVHRRLRGQRRRRGQAAKRPTAVTIKDNVIVLNVHSNRKSVSHGFFAKIFLALDRHGIVVDLIATSEMHVSMALSPNVKENKLEKALLELRKCGTLPFADIYPPPFSAYVDVIRKMAILSLVGRQMRNMVGIAGLMFDTLARHNVNIEMISHDRGPDRDTRRVHTGPMLQQQRRWGRGRGGGRAGGARQGACPAGAA
ncbi:hypothetical protein PhCBS80983_g01570 [Powellomyces hirtus]|uniref:aspartate kinase n=1 Tax=Powellomyces hirtus TaxID=109895 RepID=A0A507EBW9_9FUNG|nr:hypothetical protein PhCBS80983_g01570 [Powellomyces hirtus]